MQPTTTLLSILGEAIQTLGVLAITLLFLMLYRVLRRAYFLRWGQAWLAMLCALVSLYLVFAFPWLGFLEPFYFAGEYVFALLLWLGFANFPQREIRLGIFFPLLLLAIVGWSIFLTYFNPHFSNRFSFHAFAFSASMIPAWVSLYKLELPQSHSWVKKVALTALSLLMFNFVLCGSSLFSSSYVSETVHTCYFAYQSIFDLIFEVLLAFSLLIIAAVNMKGELERANQILKGERDNMSMLANCDALTGCLNRHAFDELQARLGDRSGLVAMVDINNLKPINDKYGHHIGDEVICRVAQTIKAHMRSQDYFFRYGGDEFVIVSFEMQESDAEQRLQDIQRSLAALQVTDLTPCKLSISWGVQQFSDERTFSQAVHVADSLMYQQKLAFHQVPADLLNP